MPMARRLSRELCASNTFLDLRRLRERRERQGLRRRSPRSHPVFCTCVLLLSSSNTLWRQPHGQAHTGKCTSGRNIVVMAASMLLHLARVFRCRGEAPPLLRPTEFLTGQYLGLCNGHWPLASRAVRHGQAEAQSGLFFWRACCPRRCAPGCPNGSLTTLQSLLQMDWPGRCIGCWSVH
jgi:hypothetical protein